MGLFAPGGTIELDPSADIIAMQRTIRGVMMGSCRIKRDIPMLADLYLQGRFNLDDLVSRTLNISEINEAYEEQETGSIARNVITSF
jgi:S-(hydroxymethyl)glutathione dehydrogenase/alcohol dehydrogenase